jgi:tRNA1(Val) A37 N6-methylase TrmN6
VLTLIWRADDAERALAILAQEFGAITLLPVVPRANAEPIRVLLRAVKGAGAGVRRLPALILNDSEGRPTPAAEAVLREAKSLTLY